MLVYYFVAFIVSNRYLLFWVSNSHNSITVQNWTHVYMNFFDHKDLGNHLLQLCPEVVKHPVEGFYFQYRSYRLPLISFVLHTRSTIHTTFYWCICLFYFRWCWFWWWNPSPQLQRAVTASSSCCKTSAIPGVCETRSAWNKVVILFEETCP